MVSSLECLSTEVIYEIFDYLNPCDIFISFINLNRPFNRILRSYPLKINFRKLSRTQMNYLSRHIKAEQVYSIELSEKLMPDQILILLHYFPEFEKKFIHVKSMTFFYMNNFSIRLPCSVSSLTFKENFPKDYSDQITNIILCHQAKFLTYLNIASINILLIHPIDCPRLTHLIINDYCPIEQFNEIFQNFPISSLNHLKLKLFSEDHIDQERFFLKHISAWI